MSARSLLLPLAAAGGLLGLVVLSAYGDHSPGADEQALRAVFHLPEDAELWFSHTGGRHEPSDGWTGLVKFTDTQLADYAAHLDDPSTWAPVAFSFQDRFIDGAYADGALRWEHGRGQPIDGRWASWAGMENFGLHEALPESQRSFCFVAVDLDTHLEMRPCHEAGDTWRVVYARGTLDLARGRLYLVIREG